jgi:peptidoglycan glycosyltransferase
MYKYMRRFGFNQKPPIDLPGDELTASGVYGKKGRLLGPSDPVDIGRVGIGQERLQVTPLQMAEVAATVANGGVRMKPRIGDRFIHPDGRLASTVHKESASRVMSSDTAAALTAMMARVVDEGTGTAAKLTGISVAGKTGTAEVANGTSNQAWFIAFAPKNDPKVAIAVTIERTQGEGGTDAAPIAKSVIQALIGAKAGG